MRRPLINIRVASFKKSIPSTHSRLMRSILLRMFQTGLLTMRSFFVYSDNDLFLLKVQSVQLTTLLHWNSSVRTVCCLRMTCCFRIWTQSRAPYTGSLAPMELEIGSGRRIYLYGRDKYRRIDRTQNVSWSVWAYLEQPKSYQDRRHRRYIVIGSVVIGFRSWMNVCRTYLNRLLRL